VLAVLLEQQPFQKNDCERGRQKDDDPHECGMPYCHDGHHRTNQLMAIITTAIRAKKMRYSIPGMAASMPKDCLLRQLNSAGGILLRLECILDEKAGIAAQVKRRHAQVTSERGSALALGNISGMLFKTLCER
jgi:hypothetical protein